MLLFIQITKCRELLCGRGEIKQGTLALTRLWRKLTIIFIIIINIAIINIVIITVEYNFLFEFVAIFIVILIVTRNAVLGITCVVRIVFVTVLVVVDNILTSIRWFQSVGKSLL